MSVPLSYTSLKVCANPHEYLTHYPFLGHRAKLTANAVNVLIFIVTTMDPTFFRHVTTSLDRHVITFYIKTIGIRVFPSGSLNLEKKTQKERARRKLATENVNKLKMNSSAADRRLSTIAGHLAVTINNGGSSISSSPTSAGDSVFANIARAPEDPILGVIFL